jgi:hypothetical protein
MVSPAIKMQPNENIKNLRFSYNILYSITKNVRQLKADYFSLAFLPWRSQHGVIMLCLFLFCPPRRVAV